MPTPPLTPAFLAYTRHGCELHQLFARGEHDSEKAEAIREASEEPWRAMTEGERERAGWLSEDLYSLSDPPPALEPMTAESQVRFGDAVEALAASEWDRALALLRSLRASLPAELLSYYRGRAWLGAGDRATAAVFLEHASRPPGPADKARALLQAVA